MRLTRHLVDEIMQAARDSLPEEACGILMAAADEPELGSALISAHNAERERPEDRYKLDHRAHILAVQAEVAESAVIVGYFHSHVRGQARPSRVDADFACPGVTYVIATADEPREVRAWRFEGEGFVEEAIIIEEAVIVEEAISVEEATHDCAVAS